MISPKNVMSTVDTTKGSAPAITESRPCCEHSRALRTTEPTHRRGSVRTREGPIGIERLAVDQGSRLRTIRLRALADAPDAFGSSFEEVAAQAPESWAMQLQEKATFVAVMDREDVGLVRAARDDLLPGAAWLMSMWVCPECRGQGVGESLIDAVIEWARASGVRRVILDVGDHNQPAIELYERKGFEPNGTTGSLPPPRSHVREHQRELRIQRPNGGRNYRVPAV